MNTQQDPKKKKKTTTTSVKQNHSNIPSAPYAYYITKSDLERNDKSQKSARSIKPENNSKPLNKERSFKTLVNLSNKSNTYLDNTNVRPKTTTHANKTTSQNQEILA
jgi:hypothetical protein